MDYEARRKEQNREAQRRYRERVKTSRKGSEKHHAGSTSSAQGYDAMSPQSEMAGSIELFGQGAEMTATFDYDAGGGFLDASFDGFAFGAFNSDTTPDGMSSFGSAGQPSVSTAPSSLFARSANTAPAIGSYTDAPKHRRSLKSATKLCAKAENLVDELERLYEFGVDVELMEPNDTLQDSLSTTRVLFRKSVNVG